MSTERDNPGTSASHDAAHVTHQSAGPLSLLGEAPLIGSVPSPATLLSHPNIRGRGNGPVRQAAIQRMQQTMGNRATRRFLQQSESAPYPIAQRANVTTTSVSSQATSAPTAGLEGVSQQSGTLRTTPGTVDGNTSAALPQTSDTNIGVPEEVREQMETAFQADFSDVRIHASSEQAADLGVSAYTRNNEIHFAPNSYQPHEQRGQELLGHELAHVVQQRQGRVAGSIQAKGFNVNTQIPLEKEADQAGVRAARSEQVEGRLLGSTSGTEVTSAPIQMESGWLWDMVQRNKWLALIGFGTAAAIVLFAYNQGTTQDVLQGLPEELWWKLFIDFQYHDEASKLKDPAMFFDKDQSKGHKENMMIAFKQELKAGSPNLGKELDAEGYKRLHTLVTAKLQDAEKVDKWSTMRHGTEEDQHPPTNFPVGGKGTPSEELYDESILGKPILTNELPTGKEASKRPNAICFFDDGLIYVNYSTPEEEEANVSEVNERYTGPTGEEFAGAVLTRYNEEVGSTKDPEEKLAAIVKAIRALHVIHAFRDANGRLHMFLMLNKFLIEQGFKPVILRNGPEIFGGSYSIQELVQEVEDGMEEFNANLPKGNGKEKTD